MTPQLCSKSLTFSRAFEAFYIAYIQGNHKMYAYESKGIVHKKMKIEMKIKILILC